MIWYCVVLNGMVLYYSIVRYGEGMVWHGVKWCVNGNHAMVGHSITRHKGIVRKNWQYCSVRYNFGHLVLFVFKTFKVFGLIEEPFLKSKNIKNERN